MTIVKIVQWDLTYTGHQVTQKQAASTQLNYTKTNVVWYNPMNREYYEEISSELKFVICLCKCHMQNSICWHNNCPNGIRFVDAMCIINMPIHIAIRTTGICGCQIFRV